MKPRATTLRDRRFRITLEDLNGWAFIAVAIAVFAVMTIYPVVSAVITSFQNYKPFGSEWVQFENYKTALTNDLFYKSIRNTAVYTLITVPLSLVIAFAVAVMILPFQRKTQSVFKSLYYIPAVASGVAMSVVWKIIFASDQMGYANYFLMELGIITEPMLFTSDANFLLPIMIIVSLWSSMGVGFLAILAGILNINPEYYEAAMIDGMRNRFQEIFYITIPQMKPQMMFAAVMAVVNTFSVGAIGVQLSGSNPTPGYAGQLIVNHIEDYGFLRYEMGYASTVSLVLLVFIYTISKVAGKVFKED